MINARAQSRSGSAPLRSNCSIISEKGVVGSRLYKTQMPCETIWLWHRCTPDRSFHRQIRGKLSFKGIGQLAGGIHHHAVGIAIRRFTQCLQSNRTLLEKVSRLSQGN